MGAEIMPVWQQVLICVGMLYVGIAFVLFVIGVFFDVGWAEEVGGNMIAVPFLLALFGPVLIGVPVAAIVLVASAFYWGFSLIF